MRIVILLLLSGCASDWTKNDTKLEITFQVVNAMDAYTTSQIRHSQWDETNIVTKSLIGINPDESDVAVLFITYGISHYLIAKALPKNWRRFYQISTIGYSTYLVANNCNLGLCP